MKNRRDKINTHVYLNDCYRVKWSRNLITEAFNVKKDDSTVNNKKTPTLSCLFQSQLDVQGTWLRVIGADALQSA